MNERALQEIIKSYDGIKASARISTFARSSVSEVLSYTD
jgi:hypothetical protein